MELINAIQWGHLGLSTWIHCTQEKIKIDCRVPHYDFGIWADPKQLETQRKCTYINGFNDSLSGYLVIHSDLRWMVPNAKHQPQYSSSSVPQWSSGPRSTLCPYRPTFFLIPYSPKLNVVKETAKELSVSPNHIYRMISAGNIKIINNK